MRCFVQQIDLLYPCEYMILRKGDLPCFQVHICTPLKHLSFSISTSNNGPAQANTSGYPLKRDQVVFPDLLPVFGISSINAGSFNLQPMLITNNSISPLLQPP